MTPPLEWRYIFGSARGASHAKNDDPCQDALYCQVIRGPGGAPFLAALVSDGAGSARRGEVGAWTVCDHFAERIEQYLLAGYPIEQLDVETVEEWLQSFQARIASIAAETGRPTRDYACTLLGAVVGDSSSAYFQVGDGAIVIAPSEARDKLEVVLWPQRGEYANVTCFVTQADAQHQLQFVQRKDRIDDLALFSDGIEHLVLNYQTKDVHLPFFIPKFEVLRCRPPGYQSELSHKLYRYLDSPVVNARTPDDKTLILATRRESNPKTNCQETPNGNDHGRESS